MSLSLRDQLLQAGLISEKQAKEAEQKAHHAQNRKSAQERKDPRQRPAGGKHPHDRRPHDRRPDERSQANPAQNEQRRKAEEARRQAADKAQAATTAQSQERERLEREKVERKARRAEIKQLIEQHRLKKPDSDDRYNFLDGTRIRRISVDPALRAGLVEAKLQIVRNEGRYEIVPTEIAERIRALDERSVMGTLSADQQPDENDPYKDYVVPDDLMW